MSSDNDKETIDLAIQSLKGGIEKLLSRAEARKPHLDYPRARKHAHRLVRHIHHLLTQLLEKRTCLQALLEWFATEWRDCLQAKLGGADTHKILAHAMQCLVRCQDGLVLLTSGECRHPVDIAQAKTTKFPSRLTTLEERKDGYTKLYAGQAYSGFGWDEYANETVGLQARLIQALRPFHKNPWGYLESSSTQLLETVLDRQEDVVKNLQQSLSAIKAQMSSDITKRLAKPTIFTTQDKLEKLQVVVPARNGQKELKISITRRADNFQIVGSSVLPNELNTADRWRRTLALHLGSNNNNNNNNKRPTAPKASLDDDSENKIASASNPCRKRRRRVAVLEDSSDSDVDDKQQPTPSYSTGLEVKVETQNVKVESEDSLTAIKAQLGVDTKGLEMARQELEHESGTSAANEDNVLGYEQGEVRRLTKILHRAEQRQHVDRDENEIWDARECLRQACMELGNQALWSSSRNLELALSSFEQAKELVLTQQKLHNENVTKTNDRTEESRLISQNLLFLLAQAHTNVGISRVEMAQIQAVGRRKQWALAIREFRRARELLAEMRSAATLEVTKCLAHSEQWIALKGDILEGDKLDSLACRWLGIALWKSGATGSLESAEKTFTEGWSLFRGFNVACRSQLLMQLLEGAVEAIYTTSTLADLACAKLEALDTQSPSSKEIGEQYLRIVTRALTKQVEILGSLENLVAESGDASDTATTIRRFQQENDLSSSQATKLESERISQWWTQRLKHPATNLASCKKAVHPLGRADITGSTTSIIDTRSGSRCGTSTGAAGYVVMVGSSWRRLGPHKDINRNNLLSQSATGNGTGGAHSRIRGSKVRNSSSPGHTRTGEFAQQVPTGNIETPALTAPVRFRKWGDEILHVMIQELRGTGQNCEKIHQHNCLPTLTASNKDDDDGYSRRGEHNGHESVTSVESPTWIYPAGPPPMPATALRSH